VASFGRVFFSEISIDFLGDNVVPVTKEETAAIVAAVQEKMDDVVPEESEEEAEDPVADQEGSNPPPIQHSIVRLLPTVEMMVENEIWQYRYPPFDNIFTPLPEEHQQQQQTEKAKSQQTDFLPSYVIGVLDPSELVDGLFSSSAAVQNQRTPTTILNSPNGEHHQQDETISSNFRLRDSVASSSNSKSDNLPRSFLIFDNDRWIWPGNNKKSSS